MKLRKDSIDITGKKFGELLAIKPIKNGKYRGVKWECLCDCGETTIAFGGHLRAGKRVSCGCRSEAKIFDTGINRLYSGYKRRAKIRNVEFSISREDFGALVSKDCNYCGIPPHQELKRLKTKKTQIIYNGIDRYDPTQGYVLGNCVSCCYYCNHAKADLTFDQWKSHLLTIFKFLRVSNEI